MTLADRARAVGIDPDDPKYHQPNDQYYWQHGDKLCGWCLRHPTRTPRLLCDIQQEKARLMRNVGKEASACSICSDAHEAPHRGVCPKCREREQAHVRTGPPGSAAMRVADGHGCVERIHPVERDIYAEWGEW